MSDQETEPARVDPADQLAEHVEQLRGETMLLALAGVGLIGLAVVAPLSLFDYPERAFVVGLGLIGLTLAVWMVRTRSYLAGAILLSAGVLVATVLAVLWLRLPEAVFLLVVPVGVATLTISRVAGTVMATACTFLLAFAPARVVPVATQARMVAGISVWVAVGMLWLTLRPLLQAVHWAWSAYEHSQTLLEESREYQRQLGETLEDLTNANVQLTRLNRKAQGLRHVAEEERAAKERFVANVSHELRTPLNMIVGFCEMITQAPETYGPSVPPALLADLDVVLRNSRHLASLIDDVLDLSQVEAGQMALTREYIALSEVIESAAVAVRPLFESKQLDLKITIPRDLPEVCCDRTRIREVVLNLLSNSGRFTEQGGVTVHARQEHRYVVVSVADTGPGISEKDQDRLFQPFQQAEGVVRRRYGGTGLGLSISRAFVELHGGRLWVESDLGQGATFLFRLPIDRSLPETASPSAHFIPGWEFRKRTRPSRVVAPVSPPRWVVLEDGNVLQQLLGRYLDRAEIVPVADLAAAEEAVSAVPTQALLVNAARMDEALQQLDGADLPYDVPVLICAVSGVEQVAATLGVRDYLLKPVSRHALLNALDRPDAVETVLVVDDDPDARRLFRRMLTSGDHDYRVIRASDGRRALRVLEREQVDVILLDLVMPEMDGVELLAAMRNRAHLRDIPVVVISARDPQDQPIVSSGVAAITRDGLSIAQLLSSIEALSAILSGTAQRADPTREEVRP